jgi:hypothetical protein
MLQRVSLIQQSVSSTNALVNPVPSTSVAGLCQSVYQGRFHQHPYNFIRQEECCTCTSNGISMGYIV